jgi:hypothetical protein
MHTRSLVMESSGPVEFLKFKMLHYIYAKVLNLEVSQLLFLKVCEPSPPPFVYTRIAYIQRVTKTTAAK